MELKNNLNHCERVLSRESECDLYMRYEFNKEYPLLLQTGLSQNADIYI